MTGFKNTYDIFSGEDLRIAELIQQRRLQILIHSCIYYEFNSNVVSDGVWDSWAKELVILQSNYPNISKQVMFASAFNGFDGSTGFDLPIRDEWVKHKARQVIGLGKSESRKQKPKGGRLF